MSMVLAVLRGIWRGAGPTYILLFVAFAVPGQHVHAEEWQSLFDGKTLTGWEATGHPESFRVVDGAIAAGGGPMTHLVYVGPVGGHDFTDFELAMDVKAMPGSNGGVFFHTEPQSGALKKGYEEVHVPALKPPPFAEGTLALQQHCSLWPSSAPGSIRGSQRLRP